MVLARRGTAPQVREVPPGARPAEKGGGISITTKAQSIGHDIGPLSTIRNHHRASSGIAEHLCLVPRVLTPSQESRFITIREHHVGEGQNALHPFHGKRVFDLNDIQHHKSTASAGLLKALLGLNAFEGVQKEKASEIMLLVNSRLAPTAEIKRRSSPSTLMTVDVAVDSCGQRLTPVV